MLQLLISVRSSVLPGSSDRILIQINKVHFRCVLSTLPAGKYILVSQLFGVLEMITVTSEMSWGTLWKPMDFSVALNKNDTHNQKPLLVYCFL